MKDHERIFSIILILPIYLATIATRLPRTKPLSLYAYPPMQRCSPSRAKITNWRMPISAFTGQTVEISLQTVEMQLHNYREHVRRPFIRYYGLQIPSTIR